MPLVIGVGRATDFTRRRAVGKTRLPHNQGAFLTNTIGDRFPLVEM